MCKLELFKTIHIKKDSGFTLVEVLIAIMLLAFISLQTFRMVDNSTSTKENVLREDQVLLQTLTAISRLDADISQLYSPLYAYSKANPVTDPNAIYQDNATPRGAYDGKTKNGIIIPQFNSEDKSTLVFLTMANRRKIADTKESRFSWVRYSVRRSENSDEDDATKDDKIANVGEYELVRQTISTNIYVNELNWADVKAQVLMTHVKSVEFTFWDERNKKFSNSLLDLNENKNAIRSLKMDLSWVDEDNHEQKIEKIFRILHPYFNSKLDDVKMGVPTNGALPPGEVTPNQDGDQGEADAHF